MTLSRRYIRNIRENLSFYISSTVLTVLTLLMFFLYEISGSAILNFSQDFYASQAREDANFTTYLPIPDEDIPKLEDEFDLELESQRVTDGNYHFTHFTAAAVAEFCGSQIVCIDFQYGDICLFVVCHDACIISSGLIRHLDLYGGCLAVTVLIVVNHMCIGDDIAILRHDDASADAGHAL